jgi:hypothetical protein
MLRPVRTLLFLCVLMGTGVHAQSAAKGPLVRGGSLLQDPVPSPGDMAALGLGPGSRFCSGTMSELPAWIPSTPILRRWSTGGQAACPLQVPARVTPRARGALSLKASSSSAPNTGLAGVQYEALEDTLTGQIRQVHWARNPQGKTTNSILRPMLELRPYLTADTPLPGFRSGVRSSFWASTSWRTPSLWKTASSRRRQAPRGRSSATSRASSAA